MNSPHVLQPETIAIKPPGPVLGAFRFAPGMMPAITDRLASDDIAARALEDRQTVPRRDGAGGDNDEC